MVGDAGKAPQDVRKVTIAFTGKAQETFNVIKEQSIQDKESRTLFRAIGYKLELIKANTHYGKPVAKRLIPREFVEKFNVRNMFHVSLPLHWRMMYSLEPGREANETIALILFIADHPTYDRRMNYR